MNYKWVSEIFRIMYKAEDVSDEECYYYCEHEIIVGLRFSDESINYLLLDENDLIALTERQITDITKLKKSPYNNLMLIFYRDEVKSEVNFKRVNGMAGKLFDIATVICEVLNEQS